MWFIRPYIWVYISPGVLGLQVLCLNQAPVAPSGPRLDESCFWLKLHIDQAKDNANGAYLVAIFSTIRTSFLATDRKAEG